MIGTFVASTLLNPVISAVILFFLQRYLSVLFYTSTNHRRRDFLLFDFLCSLFLGVYPHPPLSPTIDVRTFRKRDFYQPSGQTPPVLVAKSWFVCVGLWRSLCPFDGFRSLTVGFTVWFKKKGRIQRAHARVPCVFHSRTLAPLRKIRIDGCPFPAFPR